MENDILVSVVCITYNQELFIKDALESFINQKTNFKYEILVHDDASTDKTPEILKQYEIKYPNLIKVIYQKVNQYSQGKNPTRNLYDIAKGKYLALCEGDDYWIDSSKLQKQVDFLENNLDYIGTSHNNYVVNKNKEKINYNNYYPLLKEHNICNIDELKYNFGLCGHTSTLLFRNFWKDLPLEEREYFLGIKAIGDQRLNLYLVLNGKMKFLSDIMSCYRVTFDTDSWTSSRKNKKTSLEDAICFFEKQRLIKERADSSFEYDISPCIWGAFSRCLKKPNKENISIFYKVIKFAKEKYKNNFDLILKLFKYIILKIKEKLFLKNKNEYWERL